jgi:CheY-like chemotaxis protein
MAETLARCGFVTRVAHDASEALAVARDFAPAAGILDIGLPVIDGYELARRLRAQPGLERMYLIAVTGYGQAEDRDRAIAAGFDHHLVKPVSGNAIRSLLDTALGASSGIPART